VMEGEFKKVQIKTQFLFGS